MLYLKIFTNFAALVSKYTYMYAIKNDSCDYVAPGVKIIAVTPCGVIANSVNSGNQVVRATEVDWDEL